MSYVNFSYTNRLVDPARTVETLRAGFSREGGKLETLETSTSSAGVLPPLTRTHELSAPVQATAASLLQAVQGAGWVQDVDVQQTLVREPATVTWTMRHGAGGTGFDGQLPREVQAVVDAARALDELVRA